MQLLNIHNCTDPLTLKLVSTLSMLLSQPELVGIITLEDVIEELIGEEIVDETDLYVDVHHRIAVARARLQNHRQSSSDPSSSTTPAERRHQRLINRSKSTDVQASEVTYWATQRFAIILYHVKQRGIYFGHSIVLISTAVKNFIWSPQEHTTSRSVSVPARSVGITSQDGKSVPPSQEAGLQVQINEEDRVPLLLSPN